MHFDGLSAAAMPPCASHCGIHGCHAASVLRCEISVVRHKGFDHIVPAPERCAMQRGLASAILCVYISTCLDEQIDGLDCLTLGLEPAARVDLVVGETRS